MSISKQSRERIALFVFLALIAFALWGAYNYITLSRTWNVAASNIDDATGQMDGYTVIVYKGTVEQKAVAEEGGSGDLAATPGADASSASSAAGKSGSVPKEGKETADPKAAASSDAPPSEPLAARTDDGADAVGTSETRGLDGLDVLEEGSEADSPADAKSPAGAGDTEGATEGGTEESKASAGSMEDEGGATAPGSEAVAAESVDIEEVKAEYEDKNATVFELMTEDMQIYREGVIVMKGGHRFGVFAIDPFMTSAMINKHVEYFEDHAVDFIVALTPDTVFAKNSKGIDILISTKDEGLFVMGQTVNDTFYVNAPAIGSVGVVLISPNEVVSAKVLNPSA